MTGKNTSIKSNKILHDNANWLLYSDIRIKNGWNKGAIYGWKNLNPVSFPFIYSEITGYAITSYCWIYSELGNVRALKAATESSDWVIKNMHSDLLFARPAVKPSEPNDLSKVFYSFDNSMVLIGFLSLYKLTKNARLLQLAEEMSKALTERFFDGEKLIARLDGSLKHIEEDVESGIVKWSTVSGPYHCKLSIALLQLAKLIGDKSYVEISDSLCDYAKKLQKSDGQFITNPGSDIVYLHPHLYACEGLIYSGLTLRNENHYDAGIKGIMWAMEQVDMKSTKGLKRDTSNKSVEQSDCTAQLLRLLILCRSRLKNSINSTEVDSITERLHTRLLDFCIRVGNDKGAMRYQRNLNSVCSWCTMFSMQALSLWSKTNSQEITWIEYFV